jgi:hypothetical protein
MKQELAWGTAATVAIVAALGISSQPGSVVSRIRRMTGRAGKPPSRQRLREKPRRKEARSRSAPIRSNYSTIFSCTKKLPALTPVTERNTHLRPCLPSFRRSSSLPHCRIRCTRISRSSSIVTLKPFSRVRRTSTIRTIRPGCRGKPKSNPIVR